MKTAGLLNLLVILSTAAAAIGLLISGQGRVSLWTLLLLAAAVMGGILLYLLYRQSKVLDYLMRSERKAGLPEDRDEKENENMSLIRKRVELSMLQNQINPHFLYNTLESIRSKAVIDKQDEIAFMTENLSRFFRYCISHKENLVKIEEELNHIRSYFYIQKYRFEDRFEMKIEVENESIAEYYIPRLTIQPLVENAMLHGLEKVKRKGMIHITLKAAQDRLILIISDNGAGMNSARLKELNDRMKQTMYEAGQMGGRHSSIALANVNTRIKLTFGEEYGIHYRSVDGMGTDAYVTIPIIDDFLRGKYEDTFEGV